MPIRGLTDGRQPPLSEQDRRRWHEQGVWVTREGRTLRVQDMTDDHLCRVTHQLIASARRERDRMASWYMTCPEPRGDMAEWFFEQEQLYWFDGGDDYSDAIDDLLWDSGDYPFWPHAAREILRRPGLAQGFYDKGLYYFTAPSDPDRERDMEC